MTTPLILVRARCADVKRAPSAPHTRVQCWKCLKACYSLGDADAEIAIYANARYECARCFYEKSMGREMFESMMDAMAESDINA